MRKKITEIKNRLHLFGQKGNWQNYLIKVLLSDLFWVLVICLSVRMFIYSCMLDGSNFANDYSYLNSDTYTYLNYKGNILQGDLDAHRTPIYPYFIKFIRFFDKDNLTQNLVFAQSVISFLSIILFFKILKYLFNHKVIVFIASVYFGIFPCFIGLEKCILPESISVFSVVLFIYLITDYLISPKSSKAILASFSVFFFIMLRPGFLYLIPIILFFWMLRFVTQKNERKICLLGLSSLLIVILLLYGYSNLNYKKNNAYTISIVSSINIMYEIINLKIYGNNSDLPITNYINLQMSGTENEARNILGSYKGKDKEEVLSKIKFNINEIKIWKLAAYDLIDNYSYARISKFITNCIKKEYVKLLKYKFLKFINISKTSATPFFPETKPGLSGTSLSIYNKLFDVSFIIVYLFLFLDVLVIIKQWIYNQKIPWLKGILWTIVIAQLCTSILGAPNSHDRLFLPALPLVLIIFFYYIDCILSRRQIINDI